MIACVDGAPVTRGEVEEHLRPPTPVRGLAMPPDPRRLALDGAIRVHLFAAEARRRGLAAPAAVSAAHRRAALHQALIRDAAPPPRIDEEEALGYYAAHPGRISEVDGVHAQGLFTTDPAHAEALYRRAVGTTEAEFAALGGVELGELHAHDGGVDLVLVRLGSSLRDPGEVGGPVQLADGRYAILRATSVAVALEPASPHLVTRIRNHLARERERSALDDLEAALRARAAIEVFDDELARLPPAPALTP